MPLLSAIINFSYNLASVYVLKGYLNDKGKKVGATHPIFKSYRRSLKFRATFIQTTKSILEVSATEIKTRENLNCLGVT